jgi:hypothetical protein
LSWVVELLPYLQDGDPGSVDKDASWNEGKNRRAGSRLVPQLLNLKAAHAPPYVQVPGQETSQPYGATHFVGMAGVGFDAAEYRADDPATAKKRGIFGYDRVTRKEDIKDGLDKTILLIQARGDHKSPWLAGGGATVRGVSKKDDALAPFVCIQYPGKPGLKTKYDGEWGTLAVMADGKVRFIPAKMDPNVFRALCTINGGEKVEKLDDIAPVVEPEEPVLKGDPSGAPKPPPVIVPPVMPTEEGKAADAPADKGKPADPAAAPMPKTSPVPGAPAPGGM